MEKVDGLVIRILASPETTHISIDDIVSLYSWINRDEIMSYLKDETVTSVELCLGNTLVGYFAVKDNNVAFIVLDKQFTQEERDSILIRIGKLLNSDKFGGNRYA